MQERFGKFELLEQIGEGGMALIYLAKPVDASFSKLVAVKRILPQLIDDPSFQEMFRREGSIAMRFRHPSIIAVYEMGAVNEQSYISMEYFPGKPVARVMTRLRDSGFSLPMLDKVTIVKRIAEALHYIHEFSDYGDSAEIVHRDISPHNIMVGFNGVTKLIDFGIAKDINQDTTQSRMIKGKIAYMSPEQVRGEPTGRQTDIFSLGIVFWELLAGKKLFTGKTIEELVTKVRACRVPLLTDIDPKLPPEINRICLKMLTQPVHSRYQTAGEVASDLNDFLRLASAEGREKSLAKLMEQLFPDDLAKVRQKLKEHEGTQGEMPALVFKPVTPRSKKKSRKRLKDSHWPEAIAMIVAVAILYQIWPGIVSRFKPAPVAAQAPAVERKVAAVVPPPMATLTVTADPRSRIWINGTLAPSVNEMKIPVGQPVVVKVLGKGWKKARVRQFTPQAASQFYFDMTK